MPDRTWEPADGERQRYTLPTGYGPARPLRRDHHYEDIHDDRPAVLLRGRNGDADDHASTNGAHSDGTTPVEYSAAPLSRRELREQREREAAEHKARMRPKKVRSQPVKWIRRGALFVVVVLLVPIGVSYVHALQRPGSDSLGVRTVEWIRDHGGNGIVNTIERWWYTNNPPIVGGRPSAITTPGTVGTTPAHPTVTTLPQPQHLPPPTARVPTPAASVEPNEGVWTPVGRLVGGLPAEFITFVRPNAANTSYWTGLMWLDTKLLRAVYVPGLQEPGGGPNPWNSEIPDSRRNDLIAAFNSGFKMDSARGGVYFSGQEVRPLVNGAASLVIYTDGSATVGAWGRDEVMGADIASVRQNLKLIVDNGQLNPALNENDTTAFGATLGNRVKVWRSGVGVDRYGGLIYAGGNALSIVDLARTLRAAGAVRAMELDINTDWVSAYTYVNQNPNDSNSPVMGIKLGGDMSRDGSRYLTTGERDFFAFFGDPRAPAPAPTITTRPARTR